jgi:ribosomal protein S18 acetylase RimI-like enzyme
MPWLPVLHSPEEDLGYFGANIGKAWQTWVTVEQDRITGFIAFDAAWIHHLYIDPDYLRRGLGTQLLEKALEQGRTLKLYTFRDNTAARSFYEMSGFSIIGESDGEENEEKLPDLLYRHAGDGL